MLKTGDKFKDVDGTIFKIASDLGYYTVLDMKKHEIYKLTPGEASVLFNNMEKIN